MEGIPPMKNHVTDVHRESLKINGIKFWIQDVRDLMGKVEYGIFVADEEGRHFYLRANSRARLVEIIIQHPRQLISPLEYSLRKSEPKSNQDDLSKEILESFNEKFF